MTMLKSTLVALSLAAASLGTSAAAQQIHTVEIRNNGYFPQTQWVNVGDIVRFVNRTSNDVRVPIVGFGNFTGFISPGSTSDITFAFGIDRKLARPTIGGAAASNVGRAWVCYGAAPTSDTHPNIARCRKEDL